MINYQLTLTKAKPGARRGRIPPPSPKKIDVEPKNEMGNELLAKLKKRRGKG